LHGDSDDINAHVDNCLASSNNGGSLSSSLSGSSSGLNSSSNSINSSSGSVTSSGTAKPRGKLGARRRGKMVSSTEGEVYETYMVGNQKRIRTCSLLEDGYAGLFGPSNTKTDEADEELNIDGDDTIQFGQAQFSESDLINMADLGTIDENEPPIITTTTITTTTQSPEQPRPQTPSQNNQTQGFIIESLKNRVRELEQSMSNRGHCMICLSWYDSPVVSINCWHVHCEKCWMSTLAAKKLCPQCNLITTPAELRRIYL
jgi:hypothetical protein